MSLSVQRRIDWCRTSLSFHTSQQLASWLPCSSTGCAKKVAPF